MTTPPQTSVGETSLLNMIQKVALTVGTVLVVGAVTAFDWRLALVVAGTALIGFGLLSDVKAPK